MTELRERIERWCGEESLALTVARDDEGGLDCTAVGESQPAVTIRSSVEQAGRLVLSHTFEYALSNELAGDAQDAERFAALAAAVVLARSSLVECRPDWGQGRASVAVTVTLFDDGLTKQSLLTGLDEVRKVGLLLERELAAASLIAGVLAEVKSIVAQAPVFASSAAPEAAQGEAAAVPEAAPVVEEVPPPVVDEVAPPAVESLVTEPTEPPPEAVAETVVAEAPQPEAVAVAPPPDSEPGIFCTNCGYKSRLGARFCRSCGGRLDGE